MTDSRRGGYGENSSTQDGQKLEDVTISTLNQLKYDTENYTWIDGYTKEQLAHLVNMEPTECAICGIKPDGGLCIDRASGLPLIAIECKYNQEQGNAIERWYKNYTVLKKLGCKKYITILMGEGFYGDNKAIRILSNIKWIEDMKGNTIFDDKDGWLSFYRFEDIQQLESSIKEILEKELFFLKQS